MKIIFETVKGAKEVDVDFTKLSQEVLEAYAYIGIQAAKDELRTRIGMDPTKPLEDYTPEDIDFYKEWLKNNDPEKRGKISESPINTDIETED